MENELTRTDYDRLFRALRSHRDRCLDDRDHLRARYGECGAVETLTGEIAQTEETYDRLRAIVRTIAQKG
jgi:hypothetical protein